MNMGKVGFSDVNSTTQKSFGPIMITDHILNPKTRLEQYWLFSTKRQNKKCFWLKGVQRT